MVEIADPRVRWTKFYDPGVPSEVTIPDVPVDELLREASKRWPNGRALYFYGRVTTFAELDHQVDAFARALQQLGVERGDRISLHLPTSPAFVVAFYGLLRAGAVAVPENPLYVVREIAELLSATRPRLSVAFDLIQPRVAAARTEAGLTGPIIVTGIRDQLPGLKALLYPLQARREGRWRPVPHTAATPNLWRLIEESDGGAVASASGAEDLAVLQPTGGTTGTPKTAMLTHRNLVANAVQAAAWNPKAQPGDRVLAVLPYFHIYGMTSAMNLAILSGEEQVLLPRLDTLELLKTAASTRPRYFPGVPALYQAMAAHKDVRRYDISSIEACLSGAAPLPEEVQRRFEEVTGGRVVEGYGLSEASPVTHCNPLYGERRNGTIGVPFPSTEATVVSLIDGRPVGPGEEGELVVRGPQVMRGYFENPTETAMAMRDGWLHTGDIAAVDDDGFFRILDRHKDLIIVGGINVWPREIEEVLLKHPLIADVAVVGVHHERMGEVPKAFVVPREGALLTVEMVVEHCRASLSGHKVPRQVEFRESLPKTMVGKVLRRELAKEDAAARAAQVPPARE